MRTAARAALREPWVGLLGRKRRGGVDEALDRQLAAVLELERIARLPALDSMAPAAARRYAKEGLSPLDVDPAPMARISDLTAGGARVRVFEPHGASDHLIVYFHGGGGVIGSIESSEPVTRLLAAQTKAAVASVEYRLGPEHPHPAAIDDVCAAYDALAPRARGRVAVAGDSFGGFLSAHVERHSRGAGRRPVDVQCLIYPIVDLTLTSPSIERHADGYLLTKSMVHWFRRHYLGDADPIEPSPWHWHDLRGSAPAIVATAGFDPLVDEGDRYAARLHDAGVAVRHRRYPSLIHGFLSLAGGVSAARAATDELCADLKELLGT